MLRWKQKAVDIFTLLPHLRAEVGTRSPALALVTLVYNPNLSFRKVWIYKAKTIMAPISWLDIPTDSHFSLANIPFGIITTPLSSSPHVGVAIGKHALDLSVFASDSGFSECPAIASHLHVFSQPTLNDFAALGRALHREVRHFLQNVFGEGEGFTKPYDRRGLFLLKDVKTHLPFRIGDYTDFFVGKHHAQNAGALIRGIDNALNPNYMHLPVGYHGRASSVVVSGTSIRRPHGQVMENPTAKIPKPIFTPSKRLDFELEIGAFVCKANEMGEPVSIKEAEENIFGLVLMNDWSARDIQGWEMVPLGPFNSKNFGTSVSAWVVLLDALEPFRTRGIENEIEVLPYMREAKKENVYDLNLEVELTSMAVSIEDTSMCANESCSEIWDLNHNHPYKRQEPPILLPSNACTSYSWWLPYASG